MTPLVTIICPVRNEEDHISECIESLVHQTFDKNNMEILIVDGMSTDRTREIVRKFQKKYRNIKLLDNPRSIIPVALNIGIKASSGKFILRMDGHAKAAPDYVERSIEILKNRPIDCVGGPIITLNPTDTGKAIAMAMSSPFGVGNSRFRTTQDMECLVDSVAFPAYKRDVFDKIGLFDEELIRCQDDEFNFRLRKYGGKVLLNPSIKSYYYSRSSFKKLWQQYFGYGFWKVRLLQKHLKMMKLRHFVPATFVTALILSLILMLTGTSIFWFFAILITYSLASIIAAYLIWRKNREINFVKILISFYVLHFSYGSGFLAGLIRFAPRWFKK
ncbi:MAG: glycosyltransferase [Calditrichaeota bacterium]|nr:MAG: glycosyltransferase [Calditrichota bacterium]